MIKRDREKAIVLFTSLLKLFGAVGQHWCRGRWVGQIGDGLRTSIASTFDGMKIADYDPKKCVFCLEGGLMHVAKTERQCRMGLIALGTYGPRISKEFNGDAMTFNDTKSTTFSDIKKEVRAALRALKAVTQ